MLTSCQALQILSITCLSLQSILGIFSFMLIKCRHTCHHLVPQNMPRTIVSFQMWFFLSGILSSDICIDNPLSFLGVYLNVTFLMTSSLTTLSEMYQLTSIKIMLHNKKTTKSQWCAIVSIYLLQMWGLVVGLSNQVGPLSVAPLILFGHVHVWRSVRD